MALPPSATPSLRWHPAGMEIDDCAGMHIQQKGGGLGLAATAIVLAAAASAAASEPLQRLGRWCAVP